MTPLPVVHNVVKDTEETVDDFEILLSDVGDVFLGDKSVDDLAPPQKENSVSNEPEFSKNLSRKFEVKVLEVKENQSKVKKLKEEQRKKAKKVVKNAHKEEQRKKAKKVVKKCS